jgi:cyclic pyranopterin phosphate synthase
MVTADEVLDLLGRDFVLRPRTDRGHAPSEDFDVLDGPDHGAWAPSWPAGVGRVGVIASVTRPFCRECDRLRLTADGQLRTCLFAQRETDLRGPMRDGASDDELAALIRTAVAGKQAGHGIDAADFVQPARTMSAIGG